MKKVVALILAVVMVLGCVTTAFASALFPSPTGKSSRSGGGSGSSSTSSSAPVYASTTVAKDGVHGEWAQAADGTWSCTVDGKKLTGWQLVYNPLTKTSEWYYFSTMGQMLVGWQWILDSDGVTRCYYLTPAGASLGACALNGRTKDGYSVDKNGAWTQGGKPVTK